MPETNQATAEALNAAAKSVPLNWGLMGVAKDFGVVATLIWFMYFVMTDALPKTQTTFLAELKEQRQHDEKRNADVVNAVKDIGKEFAAEVRRLHSGTK